MDADRRSARPARRRPLGRVFRGLLLLPLPPGGMRIVDMLVLFLGLPVAILVCVPILAVTLTTGAAVGLLLTELGAPEVILAVPGLVGFFGGLALGFLALVGIYRRLPVAIRAWVASEDEDEVPRAPIPGRNLDADTSSLKEPNRLHDVAVPNRLRDLDGPSAKRPKR